jgi:hypothetical protein
MLDQFLYELCELFPPEAVYVSKDLVTLTLFEQDMMTPNINERLGDAQILTYHYKDVIESITVTDSSYEAIFGGTKIRYNLKPNPILVLS